MIPLRPTTDRWVARACAHLEDLLLDHAHCEKKAASTAIGFVFRCPENARLVLAASRLAREELLHFERLQEILRARSVQFRRLRPSEYAGQLVGHVRRARSSEKDLLPQIVDELLVAALIEARSTERFRRLAPAIEDRELSELFSELAEVEARHEEVYIDLAGDFAPAAKVGVRLAQLIDLEGDVIESPQSPLRLHAG